MLCLNVYALKVSPSLFCLNVYALKVSPSLFCLKVYVPGVFSVYLRNILQLEKLFYLCITFEKTNNEYARYKIPFLLQTSD
jgi:hypothetical protein